jgi:transposase
MKATDEELAKSLKGNLTTHHRFMLTLIRKSLEDKENIIAEIDKQIDIHLTAHELKADSELLSTIPGVGKDAAASLIAEIGNDMNQFPNEHHLASWAGLSPGNNESGGKKKSGRITHGNKFLRTLVVQCAWAATRTKGTYLRSKYDSLVVRKGKKKALIAVGHKILIAAYFILKDKQAYKELGMDFLESKKQKKQADALISKLKDLGYDVTEIMKQVA